jgi:hypothetical protein
VISPSGRDRCTWLGTTQDAGDGPDEVEFAYGTLGPDLYGGGAGVALFLAEAFRPGRKPTVAGDRARRIHHALDRAATIPAAMRDGFYTGHVASRTRR